MQSKINSNVIVKWAKRPTYVGYEAFFYTPA